METQAETMIVEVAYARPDVQIVMEVQVPPEATVAQAIEISGIRAQFPEIDLEAGSKAGIFGKLSRPDALLHERDRVEIYRALIADPKEVRRQRTAEGKRMKKGGGDADGE